MRRLIPLCLSVICVFLLGSGCNLRPAPVTIKTYVIDSRVTIPEKLVSKPFPTTLILSPVLGALPLRTQKILYRPSEVALRPYLYSRWEYAPTHMLMIKMIDAISASGLFKAVSYRATGTHGGLYLETTLLDFTQHLSVDGESSKGVVSVMFHLIDGKTRNIIASKKYVIEKPTPSYDAQGAVLALNAASDELCLKLLAWLKITLESLSTLP